MPTRESPSVTPHSERLRALVAAGARPSLGFAWPRSPRDGVRRVLPLPRSRAAIAVAAVLFTVMCVHYGLMLGDTAALTAGANGSAHPDQRGAMMAVYSFTGFSAALMAPLVFGVVLDIAGGNRSTVAWGLAYASIGIFGALAPIARWLNKKYYWEFVR